jgi:hypothetical protein
MLVLAKEHDVIKLKDGREGTVVYVGKEPPGYLIELSDKEGEVVEVSPEQVKEIIYRA